MAEKKEEKKEVKETKQSQGIKLDWSHKKAVTINEYKGVEGKKK